MSDLLQVPAKDLKPGDIIMIRSMGGDLPVDVDDVIDLGNGTIKLCLFEPSAAGPLQDVTDADTLVRKIP